MRSAPLPFRIAVLVTGLAVVASACSHLTPLSTKQAMERLNISTTKVYDADGNVIANLHGEINRDIVPLAEIPPPMRDAAVAIEDERFYSHQGIDLRSIIRAARSNASAATGGVQGGSTITQQLAKNLYFSRPSRTVSRKIAEARVTLQLERTYSKDKILEMYLNTIYLGRGVYGVEAAAHSYFGKPASALTLADAAFLAGLIHEPGRYEWSPSDPPQRQAERKAAAEARRNVVLEKMAALGFITRQDARDGEHTPLRVKSVGEDRWRYPYFVDLVLRQLGVLRSSPNDALDPRFDFLGRSFADRAARAYRGGLRIYTTLDPHAQAAAEQAVATQLPSDLTRLSAALAAIEPSTGYVRALVGGRDYYPDCRKYSAANAPQSCRLARVNLALGDQGGGSGRQPGSSFKPFVLTAALERGIPVSQQYASDEFSYSYLGGTWNVHNYEGEGGGYRDLVDATAHSINAVYAHLEIDGVGDGNGLVGAQRVATIARRMGIDLPTPDQLKARCGKNYLHTDACQPADLTPAIALGAKEVSPYEMASAYATFADDGVRVEPTAIVRVTDPEGNVLYQAQPDERRVVPSGISRAVTAVLQTVIQRGTGTAAALDRPAAGKTGTSESWHDAWFDGYVPQLAASVWVGDPMSILDSMTPDNGYPYKVVGGTIPAMIWHAFMSQTLRGISVRAFTPAPAVFFNPTLAAATPAPTATDTAMPATPVPTTAAYATVPDVTDERLGRASADVSRAGYDVATVRECDPSGNASPGDVWKQSPSGGTSAPQNSTVTLWYGGGDC